MIRRTCLHGAVALGLCTGLLFLVMFVELFIIHFDLPDESWRLLIQEQLHKRTNEWKTATDEQEKTQLQYRVMLLQHELGQKDLKQVEDNLEMIRPHVHLIPILCLLFAVTVRIPGNPNPWSTVGVHFLTGTLFSLALLLVEPALALLTGHLFLDFEGFFRPVAVVADHRVVELSPWKYLWVTRGGLMIQLLVVCAAGVFIRSLLKDRLTSLAVTMILVPLVLFLLWDPGEMEPFVFYKYHTLHGYFFRELYVEIPQGASFGFALMVHGITLAAFLLGAWFVRVQFSSKTDQIQG
jgi:hypothetical protein